MDPKGSSSVGDEALFGRWLQKRRRSLGLTQRDLATAARCSVAMVRKIEAEERRPSKGLADRLARIVDVPAEEREAFALFARGGWSDRPPAASRPLDDRPWLALRPEASGWERVPTEDVPSPEPHPLVAREAEMERLRSALRQATAGRAGVVLVRGEAGQGKTALLQAFAHEVRKAHPEALVAWGSCNAYSGRGDPYLPFREILQGLLADVAPAPPGEEPARGLAAAAVAELGPDLIGTFLPAPSSAGGRAPMERGALMTQYGAVLARIARWRPLVLVLDDLQWIDDASADLLLHLGKHLGGRRILLLGSYRETEVALGRDGGRHPLASCVNELRREFGDVVLDLDARDDRAFVDAWLDREPNALDEAFREALQRQTGGHPLFVVELTRALQERGDLRRDHDGRWTARPAIRWDALPARIEGVIDERVGRLSPRFQAWLRVAAVEGETFSAEVLAHVLRAPVRDVARDLSSELSGTHRLIAAQEVRRVDGVGISRYRFRHHLIQRRLYERLDVVERSHLHEAVADALADLHAHRIDEVAVQLAHHYGAAGAFDRALEPLRRAGRNARRAGALEEAVRHFRAALAAGEATGSPTDAATVRELAECLWLDGQHLEAQAALARAYAAYDAVGDRQGAGAVQRLMGRVSWEMGRRADSLRHYDRSLEILQDGPPTRELAWTLSSISQMHMLAEEHDEAVAWGERALETARGLDARDVAAHALDNIGTSLLHGWPERAAEGEAKLVESWRSALELGLPHDACRASFNLAEALRAHDRADDARDILEDLVRYADRSGVLLFSRAGRSELFDLERSHGRWREAFANPTWTERPEPGTELRGAGPTLQGLYVAAAHTDLGDPERALRLLDDAAPAVASQDELQVTLPHLGERIRALAALDRSLELEGHVERLLEVSAAAPFTKHGAHRGLLAACAWLAGRNARHDRDVLEGCAIQLQRLRRQYASRGAAAAAREGEGYASMLGERFAEAAERLQDAAERWEALGLPLDRLRALDALSAALRRSGRPSEARSVFEASDAILAVLGDEVEEPYVKACVARIRRGRRRRARPA